MYVIITDLAVSLALLGNEAQGIRLCSPHHFLMRATHRLGRGTHRLGMLSVGNEGGTEIGREERGGMREGWRQREGGWLVLTPVIALMYDI